MIQIGKNGVVRLVIGVKPYFHDETRNITGFRLQIKNREGYLETFSGQVKTTPCPVGWGLKGKPFLVHVQSYFQNKIELIR